MRDGGFTRMQVLDFHPAIGHWVEVLCSECEGKGAKGTARCEDCDGTGSEWGWKRDTHLPGVGERNEVVAGRP